MEDRKINGMESLELISEMILKTKQTSVTKKDYNAFLVYGYGAAIIAAAAWALIHISGKMEYMFVWFAMFIPYLYTTLLKRGGTPKVKTYLEEMIQSVWKIIGSMFGLTVGAIIVIGAMTGTINFSLMMPLSIIYAGIGTSITGLVLKENWFVWTPLAGLAAAVYMLMDGSCDNSWNLIFGASMLIFMAVPAHIVRYGLGRND